MADGGLLQPNQQFRPSAENQRALRSAFGQFATGVTLVTAISQDSPIGMTVNSFSSLSLDPALLLWSVACSSSRHDRFTTASHFAVHILCSAQSDLALEFARSGFAFEAGCFGMNASGVPVLDHCLARFDCRLSARHPGGDHTIIVGAIENVVAGQGDPLTFYDGEFGALTA